MHPHDRYDRPGRPWVDPGPPPGTEPPRKDNGRLIGIGLALVFIAILCACCAAVVTVTEPDETPTAPRGATTVYDA